jgi:hypothetical protein
MRTVTITAHEKFAAETPLLIIGAGAAGLCAAVPVANLIRLAVDRESGNPVVG